jgi:hypothetical protein
MTNVSIKEIEAKFLQLDKMIDELTTVWERLIPSVPVPSRKQFSLWLKLHNHDMEIIMHGLTQTAAKARWMEKRMEEDHAIRYASSCMNNFKRQRKLAA